MIAFLAGLLHQCADVELVGEAADGATAVRVIEAHRPDLALIDLQMPEVDGLEATRMVRLCLEKQPVIIAMTANALDGDQDNCIQAGMDDYIGGIHVMTGYQF